MLVIGSDLGAAVGPLLGYSLLQLNLPASCILLVQSVLHAIAGGLSGVCPGGASEAVSSQRWS